MKPAIEGSYNDENPYCDGLEVCMLWKKHFAIVVTIILISLLIFFADNLFTLTLLAEFENYDAQYRLGNMYYYGYGVNKDYKKAVEWYQKSADQGYKLAQNDLGHMYDQGYGIDKDYKRAIEWYQKSADQGCEDAQYSLGNMYYYGYGVDKDYKKAIEWYQKSADK